MRVLWPESPLLTCWVMDVKGGWGPQTRIKIYLVSSGYNHWEALLYSHRPNSPPELVNPSSSHSFFKFSSVYPFSRSFLNLPGVYSTLIKVYRRRNVPQKKSGIWIPSCIWSIWSLLYFVCEYSSPGIKCEEDCRNSLLAGSQEKT